MDQYCTKHKKALVERYHRATQEIEVYCVDCEIENKYETQVQNSSQVKRKIMKNLSGKIWTVLVVCTLIVLFIPIHTFVKIILCFMLFILAIKIIFDPFLSRPPEDRKPDWDDIRAKALNQSSIQANEVANIKRQWKKGFLQENKHTAWTEEEWQQYLKQHYRK
ncbi:hypothetical protein [Bacillus sp. RO1]|uniref:hypothetical protein n=1 Tax=Bacillus sp. RO1 TaxID=2722703 RepID=UPI00145765FD|nr:hypothetical protein [Bacillus sp. RO1]NLP52861.1 hypothetical protein [Bacillus sp. RO1]